MASRNDLLSSIRSFKKNNLAKADTVDKSAPAVAAARPSSQSVSGDSSSASSAPAGKGSIADRARALTFALPFGGPAPAPAAAKPSPAAAPSGGAAGDSSIARAPASAAVPVAPPVPSLSLPVVPEARPASSADADKSSKSKSKRKESKADDKKRSRKDKDRAGRDSKEPSSERRQVSSVDDFFGASPAGAGSYVAPVAVPAPAARPRVSTTTATAGAAAVAASSPPQSLRTLSSQPASKPPAGGLGTVSSSDGMQSSLDSIQSNTSGTAPSDKKARKEKRQRDKQQREQAVLRVSVVSGFQPPPDQYHSQTVRLFLMMVVWMTFLAYADLAIILPGLFISVAEMGGSYLQYGCVVAAFNIGQIVLAPALGAWSDRRHLKEVLLFCSVFGFAGNLWYWLADPHSKGSLLGLAVARLIAGVGAAHSLVGYAYLVRVSRAGAQRDKRISLYSWGSKLAMVFAPVLGSYANPPLVMWIAYAVSMAVLAVFVVLTRAEPLQPDATVLAQGRALAEAGGDGVDAHDSTSTNTASKPAFVGGDILMNRHTAVLLLNYFAAVFAYWIFACSVFPYVQAEEGWGQHRSYFLFVLMGCAFTASFLLHQLVQRAGLRLLIVPPIIAAISYTFFFQYHSGAMASWQVYVAALGVACAFSFATLLIPPIFSSMVGLKMENLALRMSWFFVVSVSAAALGPLLGSYILQHHSVNFVSMTALLVVGVSFVALLASPLQPPAARRAVLGQDNDMRQLLLREDEGLDGGMV